MLKFFLWLIYTIIFIFAPLGTYFIVMDFPIIEVPFDILHYWFIGFFLDFAFSLGLALFYILGKGAIDSIIERRR